MKSFTKAGEPDSIRCDTMEQLQQRGCLRDEIEFPVNSITITQNSPLSSDTQLTPQEVHLKLRIGMVCLASPTPFCSPPGSPGMQWHVAARISSPFLPKDWRIPVGHGQWGEM